MTEINARMPLPESNSQSLSRIHKTKEKHSCFSNERSQVVSCRVLMIGVRCNYHRNANVLLSGVDVSCDGLRELDHNDAVK